MLLLIQRNKFLNRATLSLTFRTVAGLNWNAVCVTGWWQIAYVCLCVGGISCKYSYFFLSDYEFACFAAIVIIKTKQVALFILCAL